MNMFDTRSKAIVVALLASACSASSHQLGDGNGNGSGNESGSSSNGGTINIGTGSSGTPGTVDIGGNGGTGGVSACATASADATLVSEPVDIIVILDNSGSMAEEMGAAEANINMNFAGILDAAGVDYRVILLSRHRVEDRAASESASTSICVSQPLSGLAACPAPLPVPSERFIQYGEKIESFDALNWVLDGYSTPPEKDELAVMTPAGWSPFMREGAKKAFIVMTDDDESNDDADTPLTADAWLTALTALGPTHFGTLEAPTFTFHSIIGIAEKADPTAAYMPDEPVNLEMCTGNGAVIESPGPTYQDLSIRTGGLRFPLCQFPGYDAVFQAIAGDVIVKAEIACDFALPAPPEGLELELDKVAVSQGDVQFGQAPTSADCQADAFYIEGERVYLCPETCDAVKANPTSGVDVLFTCESTIIVK